MSSLKTIGTTLSRFIFSRNIHLSRPTFGADAREKREGHLAKKDKVEGEFGTFESSKNSYELVDENLMDKIIDGVRFKDIHVLSIVCTRNNTKVHITDGDDKFLISKTAGSEGYKNCRKGTTVAAQAVANRVLTYVKDHGIDKVRLKFHGLGPGRNAAFRVFELSDLKIISLSDRTQAAEPWNQRPRATKSI